MPGQELIAVHVFCTHQGVEATFVTALHERGLIETIVVENGSFLHAEQLPRVERLARMYYDLSINLEGLEAISHLLERVERLQQELRALRQHLLVQELDQ